MSDDNEVGYGKPPKHAQFKKGQSGNPRGRPKGTKNLKTDLAEELAEQVRIREGNQTKKVTKQRAMVKSLVAKAANGETRAVTLVVNMASRLFEMELDGGEEDLSAEERAIFETFEAGVLQRARKQAHGKPGAEKVNGPKTRPRSKDRKGRK